METTIQNIYRRSIPVEKKISVLDSFKKWADKQEANRFTWTAISVAGHGCFFTIATVMIILFTGNNFIFWPFAIAAMTACLVTNLAALPLRIIISVFIISLLIDLTIIVLALSNGFNMDAPFR